MVVGLIGKRARIMRQDTLRRKVDTQTQANNGPGKRT
jgi:hypothetical protein